MKRLMTALLYSVLIAIPVAADDLRSPLQGAWTGTIGDLPINACFSLEVAHQYGAYYYLSHLQLIELGEKDDGKIWWEGDRFQETQKGPAWKMDPLTGDVATGTWADKEKTLPIKLKRLTFGEEESVAPCASDAFFKPRITPPKIIETPAKQDGITYTKIVSDVGKQFKVEVESFKLSGNSAAIRKVNDVLLQKIGSLGKAPEYVECIKGGLETFGSDGDYSDTFAPDILTKHWLVATDINDSSCGGAHPNTSSTEYVFDLQTGNVVEVANMLNKSSVNTAGKPLMTLQGQLKETVLKLQLKENPDCVEEVKAAQNTDVSLATAGLSFTPRVLGREGPCRNAVVISFADIQPFLTPAGKARLKSFQDELPKQ